MMERTLVLIARSLEVIPVWPRATNFSSSRTGVVGAVEGVVATEIARGYQW